MRSLRYAGAVAIAVAAMAMLVAGGGGATAQGADSGQRRPNVIVLMSDDEDSASHDVMKHTNHLIGDRGATFENSFTSWPLCCPSRATFLTGQYAHNHGVLGNVPPLGGFGRLDGSETLPVWLQRSGYYTAEIGKYVNGYENSQVGVPPGWSEWHGTKVTLLYYGEQLLENGRVNTYGSPNENPDHPAQPNTYSTDVFTNKAVNVINEQAPSPRPFFLYVAYLAPHGGGPDTAPGGTHYRCEGTAKPAIRDLNVFSRKPLPQPPNFNETPINDKPHGIATNPPLGPTQIRTATRRYRCRLGSLLAVDDGVKRIVKALRHQGELDSTLLIYTSDNGFFSGEHRITTGKNRVYEEGIRVPLQMRGPGIPKGVKVDDLAINADLAPTILDAAGATAGRTEDGVSLIGAAKHPDRLRGRRLLLEQLTTTPDDDGQPGVTYTAVRTARYKYVLNGTGEVELYDLRSDPYELQNQNSNPAYAAVESALAEDLAQLRNCSGKSCKAKPALRLKLPHEKRSGGRSCRPAKHFVARVRGADTKSVTTLTFRVGPKAAGHDHAEPLRKKLKARLLRSKRHPQIRAIADLLDGRRVSMQRRVRIC